MSSEKEIWEIHPCVSHYTTIEAALNILESKNLRASHYESLEDTREIIEAKKYLIRAFLAEFPSMSEEDVKHDIDNILYEALGRNIYLLSFSKMPNKCNLDDISGLLSMWRYYAKDNGCYIEFDTRLIYRIVNYVHSENEARVMDEVLYNQDKKLDLAKEVAIGWRRCCYGTEKKLLKKVDGKFLEAFLQVLIQSKHPSFQDEREIRIGIALEARAFSMHNRPPYIEWSFDPRAVKRIVVGPSEEQVDNVVKLRSYISGLREYEHVSIEKSDIPIRMHQK